jgi:hypothetical protein
MRVSNCGMGGCYSESGYPTGLCEAWTFWPPHTSLMINAVSHSIWAEMTNSTVVASACCWPGRGAKGHRCRVVVGAGGWLFATRLWLRVGPLSVPTQERDGECAELRERGTSQVAEQGEEGLQGGLCQGGDQPCRQPSVLRTSGAAPAQILVPLRTAWRWGADRQARLQGGCRQKEGVVS